MQSSYSSNVQPTEVNTICEIVTKGHCSYWHTHWNCTDKDGHETETKVCIQPYSFHKGTAYPFVEEGLAIFTDSPFYCRPPLCPLWCSWGFKWFPRIKTWEVSLGFSKMKTQVIFSLLINHVRRAKCRRWRVDKPRCLYRSRLVHGIFALFS